MGNWDIGNLVVGVGHAWRHGACALAMSLSRVDGWHNDPDEPKSVRHKSKLIAIITHVRGAT
jgi:hypothetical protein